MPATPHQRSLLNRISIRRNQVVSMENHHDQEQSDHHLFQKTVADKLAGLIPSGTGDDTPSVLSIAWFHKLLDVFLCCEAEFKMVLLTGHDSAQLNKPPVDRLLQEYMERVVKALDVCNAVTHAVDAVRHWQKLAEIAVAALEQRPIGEGQIRRAKKALKTLLMCMNIDDKDNQTGNSAERAWSFNRRGGSTVPAAPQRDRSNFRSFSFSTKSWSSAKQIQSMTANLVAPRGGEASGLGTPVYIMSTILGFAMWVLVAALPCQERNGLVAHFPVAKQLGWAQPIIFVQEKIGVLGEELKKEKRGSGGMLEETQRMEKLANSLMELTEAVAEEEMAAQVGELGEICGKMEEGLGALQQEVREVFHRIARSRAEVLDLVDQFGKMSASTLPS